MRAFCWQVRDGSLTRNGMPPCLALPVQRALTRLTFDEGLQTGATWSPDGRYIAYSSDRGGKSDIWLQQVSGGDPIQVTKGPGQNWQPDWSPDGRYIAYRSEESDGGIYITPALGGVGQQRKIAPFGYYPLWSPDNSEMLLQTRFATGSNRFYIAQLDGARHAKCGGIPRAKETFGNVCCLASGRKENHRLGRRFLTKP